MSALNGNLPSYPATKKNRLYILKVLESYVPKSGKILETASGTGEHIVYFAKYFPNLFWQPSDRIDDFFWAINYRIDNKKNIFKPIILDLNSYNKHKFFKNYDLLININMIHISPYKTISGLFNFGKKHLKKGGFIYMYGPFMENGRHTSKSNEIFDLQLQSQNSNWGVRSKEDVISIAKSCNFVFLKRVTMPANNLSLIFVRN